jgi:CRISPR system Cascade subunit CasB
VTRLSIVLVTWQNAPHIAQAMESCLWPASRPEVLVIHNAGGDGTFHEIARVSARHPGRFRVIDNPANAGLGPARNQGLAAATGDHLLFLDGDDWFLPGAEAALLPLLASGPDLCAFGHRRVWDHGRSAENPHAAVLSPTGDATLRRTDLARSLNTAWAKCYRRQFLLDHGLAFPAGLYEDLPFHFRTLTLAHAITATPAPLVAYRQRPGSLLHTQGAGHLQVLDRWAEVMAFTAGHPAMDRAAVAIARTQLMGVFTNDDRLADADRPAFLAGMLALLPPWRRRAGLPAHDRTLMAARCLGPRGLIAAHRLRQRLSPRRPR